ncbi:EthD family reductase [bacterium]|nr:EthD family reductase [bacterium]
MVKVSILYTNKEGAQFDHDYYRDHHMPMIKEKLGPALQETRIDIGIAGGAPGVPAPFVCFGHLIFDSAETFQQVFAENAEAIMADIPNYTDIEPIIQISEIIQ